MLQRVLAAHPSASPALLGVLAEHQLTTADPPTCRALLTRDDLPAGARRAVVDAIARAVAPHVDVSDLPEEDVLACATAGARTSTWTAVADCMPRLPPELAGEAVRAPTDGPPRDTQRLWLTIANDPGHPGEVRAQALTRAARVLPLRLDSVRALAALATLLGPDPARLVGRAGDPTTTTLLRAAATPYPDHERAEDIATRLHCAVGARSTDAYLTSRCVLLRSGARAEQVAATALSDPTVGVAVLDAVAATPTLSADLRREALGQRLRVRSDGDLTRPLDAAESLAAVASTADVMGFLLSAGRVLPALAAADLRPAHIHAALTALTVPRTQRQMPAELLAAVHASLATVPSAGDEHRQRAVAALRTMAPGPVVDRARAVLEVAGGTAPRWQDVPTSVAGDVHPLTPGLRRVVDLAVERALREVVVTSGAARALLMLLDQQFVGTVAELADLTATISL